MVAFINEHTAKIHTEQTGLYIRRTIRSASGTERERGRIIQRNSVRTVKHVSLSYVDKLGYKTATILYTITLLYKCMQLATKQCSISI